MEPSRLLVWVAIGRVPIIGVVVARLPSNTSTPRYCSSVADARTGSSTVEKFFKRCFEALVGRAETASGRRFYVLTAPSALLVFYGVW
ncbi:MAG: hypothetical protein ABSD89_04515 [Halobacteriota archaeon]